MDGPVLIAPDKLRGTATAGVAAAAIAAAFTDEIVDRCPLSDGGEGFLDALGGGNRRSTVTDPLGRPIEIAWRLDGGLAVIETAPISARALAEDPTPAQAEAATSRGAGEVLAAAIAAGANTVLIGLGGSAFSDGGRGAWSVLTEPFDVEVRVAGDVRTRYLDAARVYGPQKGADPATVERLSTALEVTATELAARYHRDPRPVDGTGAAGGLAGLLWALGARIESGLDLVADHVRLDERIRAAGLIVTAEGRLDRTSLSGKVVGGLLERAAGTRTWILAGRIEPGLMIPGVRLVDLSERFGADRAWRDTASCLTEATHQLRAEAG